MNTFFFYFKLTRSMNIFSNRIKYSLVFPTSPPPAAAGFHALIIKIQLPDRDVKTVPSYNLKRSNYRTSNEFIESIFFFCCKIHKYHWITKQSKNNPNRLILGVQTIGLSAEYKLEWWLLMIHYIFIPFRLIYVRFRYLYCWVFRISRRLGVLC